jgi:GntR family transcriptional regulator/MocR family aminotransferase
MISEYRYVSRPLSSLQGLDRNARVIYVGTFSKILFPALRIGYLVVPRNLIAAFSAVREAADIFPPTLPQRVLKDFIAQGHLARHLRQMRGIYAERLECLNNEFVAQMGGLAHIEVAESGLHVVAFPYGDEDDHLLTKEAARRGVTTAPLSSCYADAPVRRGLILGFGSVSRPLIVHGVRSLVQAFEAVNSS